MTQQDFLAVTKSDLPLMLGGNVFGWSAGVEDSFAVLDAFVEAGGRLIDTADAYSQFAPGNSGGESETIIGQWVAARGNRDQVFLTTKVGSLNGFTGLSAANIAAAAENSLRRLQTDHLDLYWAHRDDANAPQDETLTAFDALVKAGKVRYLGASNFTGDRLASALKISADESLTAYSAVQPHYNLLETAEYEADLAPVVEAGGLVCLPFFGLAKGFLTGKYRPGVTIDSPRAEGASSYLDERGLRVLAELDVLAERHHAPLAAIALAWLGQQPTVLAPIASARNLSQFADLAQLASLSLSPDELASLRAAAAV